MTYQPYPTGGSGNDMTQPPSRPASIQNAVKLIRSGAARSVIGFDTYQPVLDRRGEGRPWLRPGQHHSATPST